MKVKAEHWINHNGTWHRPGEEYETDEADQEASDDVHVQEAPGAEQPAKRGRRKKTEE